MSEHESIGERIAREWSHKHHGHLMWQPGVPDLAAVIDKVIDRERQRAESAEREAAKQKREATKQRLALREAERERDEYRQGASAEARIADEMKDRFVRLEEAARTAPCPYDPWTDREGFCEWCGDGSRPDCWKRRAVLDGKGQVNGLGERAPIGSRDESPDPCVEREDSVPASEPAPADDYDPLCYEHDEAVRTVDGKCPLCEAEGEEPAPDDDEARALVRLCKALEDPLAISRAKSKLATVRRETEERVREQTAGAMSQQREQEVRREEREACISDVADAATLDHAITAIRARDEGGRG